MHKTRTTFAALLTLTIAACGGAAPQGDGTKTGGTPDGATPPKTETSPQAAAPTAAPAATPTAPPAATPAETATAAPKEAPAPPAEKWADLESSPGSADLDAGAAAIKKGDWVSARKLLGTALEKNPKASLDVTLAGQALLGRASAEAKDEKAADKAYGKVLEAFKDPEAAKKSLDAMGGDDAAKKQRLQRAMLAVGEALHYQAEKKRKEADAITAPAYKGPGNRESVLEHINKNVAPWVKEKRKKIEEAEQAYAKVVQLSPAPPRWVVDSAARVGMMWGKFVAEFRAAPVPNEWKGTGKIPGTDITREEIRKEFYGKLDEASEPQKQKAREAFEVCQREATKYAYEDDMTKSCNAWLEKNK